MEKGGAQDGDHGGGRAGWPSSSRWRRPPLPRAGRWCGLHRRLAAPRSSSVPGYTASTSREAMEQAGHSVRRQLSWANKDRNQRLAAWDKKQFEQLVFHRNSRSTWMVCSAALFKFGDSRLTSHSGWSLVVSAGKCLDLLLVHLQDTCTEATLE
nr:uncharacterized protein LOC127293868 [Lolium perenne]